MPFSTYGANWMLDAIAYARGNARTVYASLHTNDPGNTGTYEATGGSPAYARKAVTLVAASSRSMSITTPYPVFDIPSGTYTHVGFWDAASSGNFLGGSALTTYPPGETFAAQGTLTLTGETFSLS